MNQDLIDKLMTEPFLELARESDSDEKVEALWSKPNQREARAVTPFSLEYPANER